MSWLISARRGSTPETSPTSAASKHSTNESEAATSASSSSSIGTLSIVVNSPIVSVKVGVLMDGDANCFTRAYTSKGRQGGRSAALELKNNVERYMRKEFFASANNVRVELVAFAFLNMKGLSNSFGDDMAAFAQGFNSSPYAVSMSDVGDVPQGASIALESHLPFLLSTCEYVLFGGTHDDGYEEILSNLAATRHRDKVILLRTTPDSAEDIPQAGLEEVRFPLLFEEQDPDERVRRSSVSTGDHSNAAATRSYSNIAASSSTGGGTATATHVPDEYDFKPLLRALLGRLGQPTPVRRPLRGSIAYELKCLSNPPIDFAVPKEFKKYSAEAESRGLIQLGVGDREGSEWIELAISIKEAKAYVEGSSNASSEASATASDDAQPSFCALVQALRGQPEGRATFTVASSKMVERGARPWGNESFARYAEKAVKAKIVETGQVAGEQFEFWIQLTPQYQLMRAAPQSPIGTRYRQIARSSPASSSRTVSPAVASGIPPKFVPLVNAFVNGRIKSTTPHSLASRLTCHGGKPFESGKWAEYLDEAKRLGIVKISSAGSGIQWVTLLVTPVPVTKEKKKK
ncbi:hypothetical protein JCM3766R1_002136 [Sporobolomyces carnicolor]